MCCSYDDADWADLLTSYDGHSLTYDEIGNPLSYYNGKSYTMSWENGRRLASLNVGGTAVSYTYDSEGIRRSKTVGYLETEYVTQNGLVVWQRENNSTLDFIYDALQRPYAVIWQTGVDELETYYYVLNQQGDVKRLVDSSGVVVARYAYDPWGKLLSISDTNGNILTSGTQTHKHKHRGRFYVLYVNVKNLSTSGADGGVYLAFLDSSGTEKNTGDGSMCCVANKQQNYT